MKVTPTQLPGVLIIEPKVFGDERGFFYESFNVREFENATGLKKAFVQDNHSRSRKGVLRGMHYQVQHTQGKLVRVTAGEVLDVALDVRRSSPNFGRWASVRLSAQNNRQLWIPEGFAHGFQTMSDECEMLYFHTAPYKQEAEGGLHPQDPRLAIGWPLPVAGLSPRDAAHPFLDANFEGVSA